MGPKATLLLTFPLALLVVLPASGQTGIVTSSGSCSGTATYSYFQGERIAFAFTPLSRGSSTPQGFPPCVNVEWTVDATGQPPRTVTWEVDPPSGTTLPTGNPTTLDTGTLTFGSHTVACTVSNAFGSADCPLTDFTVDHLSFTGAPAWQPADGTTVDFSANTVGATEWNWDFGDGTSSGWLTACPGFEPSHTYAVAGTYTVTVQARNCREGPLTSSPIDIQAGEVKILQFAAECPLGFCFFAPGDTVFFQQSFEGSPETYRYDWDGDGSFDEISAAPVTSHVYTEVGDFQPILNVQQGVLQDTLTHSKVISVRDVLPDPPSGLEVTIVGRSISSSGAVGVEPGGAVESAVVTATWADNSDNEDGFLLERQRDSDPFEVFAQTGPGATALEDFTLAAGHVWQLQVKAFNSAGDSSASNTVTLDLTDF